MLSSRKVVCENFFVVCLAGRLDELKNLYPTIPAIEVTIPHAHTSLNSTFFKRNRCANKKFVVSD